MLLYASAEERVFADFIPLATQCSRRFGTVRAAGCRSVIVRSAPIIGEMGRAVVYNMTDFLDDVPHPSLLPGGLVSSLIFGQDRFLLLHSFHYSPSVRRGLELR